jgi:hypothetical protein
MTQAADSSEAMANFNQTTRQQITEYSGHGSGILKTWQ